MPPSKLKTPLPGLSRRYTTGPLGVKISPSKEKLIPTTGSYPAGFRAAGVLVGVKPSNTTRADLALVASDRPCAAAAVFTKNKFQAAPVTYSRELLVRTAGRGVRSVVVNSGCANAVTGKGGLEDAGRMARGADRCLLGPGAGTGEGDGTLVMSTGVIGQRLPIQRILDGIPKAVANLGQSHDHWLACSKAICTTDTFPKLLSRTFSLPSSPGTTYSIAGMTKGAGMIHPNLATLLGILATDAPLSSSVVGPLLRKSVDRSFNSITIDGDTSTNDTIALLANGAAGGSPVEDVRGRDFEAMTEVLSDFATDLAKLIVRDGEGATKFVTIKVRGAKTEAAARKVASTIARSPLVKTALYGKDANWGRILCATGYALVSEPGSDVTAVDEVVPERTSVSFIPTDGSAEMRLLVNGEPETMDEERASEILALEDLEILVQLGTGEAEATYYTCDYSHEYITINGDYRT